MGNIKNPTTTDEALMGESTSEIIKVNYESEQPTVSARDLYEKVGTTERFSAWFERQLQFGFEHGKDYFNPYQKLWVQKERNREARREVEDYDLSIDMANHICLIDKMEKAKEYYQHLVDLDKGWSTPEKVMERKLEIAHKSMEKIRHQSALHIIDSQRMKPKEDFLMR